MIFLGTEINLLHLYELRNSEFKTGRKNEKEFLHFPVNHPIILTNKNLINLKIKQDLI